MKKVSGFLIIDVLIKLVCAVLGVLFWPPLVSIGVLVAAVFIMIVRITHIKEHLTVDDNE